MRRALILLMPLIVLVLGVPWYFGTDTGWRLFGFPAWIVFSLCSALVFAVCVAVLLGRCWDLSAGGDENDAPDR